VREARAMTACLRLLARRDLFAFPYPIAIWREPPRSLEILADIMESHGIRHLYAVGDVVTSNLLSRGVVPTSVAVDGRSAGRQYRHDLGSLYRVVTVHNPPSRITGEAWSAVREAVRGGIAVRVDGEEDMLALAFIKLAPPRSLVVYGHYAGALVAVMVDWYRDAILKLFEYMGEC